MGSVIETVGETVTEGPVTAEDVKAATEPVDVQDLPIYTVARAAEWMKRPENAARIQRAAERMREIQDGIVFGIDRELTNLKNVMVEAATDENEGKKLIDHLLHTLIGD